MNKKTTFCAILVVTIAFMTQSSSASSVNVDIASMNVHAPKGFDSNDNVEIIVTGTLPDSCHKKPKGQAKIHDNNVAITVTATKIHGEICIKASVPYLVSVPLGQLDQGSYKVSVNPGEVSEKYSILDIEKPGSDAIDDFSYANITAINKGQDKSSIVIQGAHPSSCTSIDRVNMVLNDAGNTLAILPIVKQNDEQCDRRLTPFAYEFTMPVVSKRDMVLHVRGIDGRALNFNWKS